MSGDEWDAYYAAGCAREKARVAKEAERIRAAARADVERGMSASAMSSKAAWAGRLAFDAYRAAVAITPRPSDDIVLATWLTWLAIADLSDAIIAAEKGGAL